MGNGKEFEEELEAYLASGYPFIGIQTHEETRALLLLKEVTKKLKTEEHHKRLFTWSATEGLVEILEDGKQEEVSDLENPKKLLSALATQEFRGYGSAVFCFCDFHAFWGDWMIARLIRELSSRLKSSQQQLVFLGPIMDLPKSFAQEVTQLEFPLPTREEFERILKVQADTNEIEIPKDAKLDKVLDAVAGLSGGQAEDAFTKALYKTGKFDPQEIIKTKANAFKSTGLLEYYEPEVGLEDVGGFANLKGWLRLRANAFTKEAREYGLVSPRGCLILGVPGCGKSLTAKAISSEWKLPCLRLDMGKIYGSLVGESERNLREAIAIAEAMAPSILWVDEIEKGIAGFQSLGKTDSGVSARVFGTLLTWMQEKKSSCFIIATANNIAGIPPELLRKGRFDELFWCDLPTSEERKEIFAIHIKKRKRETSKYNLDELAGSSAGFTGSEIEETINSAMFYAFSLGKDFETEHILQAIKNTVPLSKTMKVEIAKIKEWAENRAVNVSGEREAKVKKVQGRKVLKGGV